MRGGNYDKAVHILDNRPSDSIWLSPPRGRQLAAAPEGPRELTRGGRVAGREERGVVHINKSQQARHALITSECNAKVSGLQRWRVIKQPVEGHFNILGRIHTQRQAVRQARREFFTFFTFVQS